MKWFPRCVKIAHLLTAGFLGFVVVPFLLLLFYNLNSFITQANEQLLEDGSYILQSMERDVDKKLDSVETIVCSLAYNSNLTTYLSRSFSGAPSFDEYSQTVVPILQSAADSASPSIQRLWVVTQNRSLPHGQSTIKHVSDAQMRELEDFLDGNLGGWYFSPEDLELNSIEDYLRQSFYYVHIVVSPYGRRVGYVVAKVQSSTLFQEFLTSPDTNRAFFLLDEENRPYMSNVTLGEDFVFPSSQDTLHKWRPVLYLCSETQRLPLKLGLAFSSSDRRLLLAGSFMSISVVVILSVLFLSVFYFLLHILIVRLRTYAYDMERIAASGFHGRLEVSRLDELGEIGTQFNDTLTEIHSLMQEKIRQETAYKDMQLQALLLQINPHFIYNTLDMFSGKLVMNGEFEIADYISDFAQMLRYNTATPGVFLSLEDEVEYTRNYVNLQRCRYGSATVLRLHIPPALLSLQVLRLLLQPVVENSFVHGFAQLPPDACRKVVITARAVRGFLVLRVRDNGQGIPPEQLRQMNERFAHPSPKAPPLKQEKRRGRIGLENINERLSLFYAGQGRIFLRSVAGRHTSVFLIFKQ